MPQAQGQALLRNFPFHLLGYAPTPVSFQLPCERLTWTLTSDPTWLFRGCEGNASVGVLGPATLTLTATDEFGASASAQVALTFVDPPPNSPPFVTITAPLDTVLARGTPVLVSGVVRDPAAGR